MFDIKKTKDECVEWIRDFFEEKTFLNFNQTERQPVRWESGLKSPAPSP